MNMAMTISQALEELNGNPMRVLKLRGDRRT